MKCKLCDKKTVDKYCELHAKAYSRILETFEDWRVAVGLSWKEYLSEIVQNPHTGSWAKEVAQNLISEKK